MNDLTVSEVIERTGVSRATIHNYIRNGRISTTRDSAGQHLIAPGELAKLPKPYKKHDQPRESEVPQGANFTMPPLVKLRVVEFEGSQEQAAAFYQSLQAAS